MMTHGPLIERFNREYGQTFVLVTHDAEVAMACHRSSTCATDGSGNKPAMAGQDLFARGRWRCPR